MRRLAQILLASVFLASFANGWLFRKKKNWPVHAVGKVTCKGKPMPYVHVDLMDKDLFFDDKMGSTTASSTGSFSVKGSGRDGLRGKPDPYIRVTYSYSGTYGKLKVVRIFKILRRDKSPKRSYSSYINFGTINFSNLHCLAYVEFYKALKHYKLQAKSPLPYSTLYIRTNALIHAGTPYSTTNVVRIPKKYEKHFTYTTAKQEFAHTIRHSFDGSLAQFLSDVIRYKYAQHHYCGKKTNTGFAFNEGWAEYWAGSCYGTYGSSPKDYRYEGNVAKALRDLQDKCRSSLYRMVRVIRYKKRSIHSFSAYNNMHYTLYKCKL